MKNILRIALAIVLFPTLASAAEGDLTIDAGVVIPVPAPGFTWQKLRESEASDKAPKIQMFVATKEGSAAKLVLTSSMTSPIPT